MRGRAGWFASEYLTKTELSEKTGNPVTVTLRVVCVWK
jgi:hypothetical protein